MANNDDDTQTTTTLLLAKRIQTTLTHVSTNKSFVAADFEDTVNIRDYLWQQWQAIFLITDDDKEDKTSKSSSSSSLLVAASSTRWFNRIYSLYAEPGRHYHTPVHLYEMFEYLSIFLSSSNDNGDDDDTGDDSLTIITSSSKSTITALRLAIFFHDVIYNPRSSTNEKDSAELFDEFVNENDGIMKRIFSDNNNIITQVKTLIIATEKHNVIIEEESTSTVSSDDTNIDNTNIIIALQKLFLDIDMAVLGKQPLLVDDDVDVDVDDAYLSYAAAIRNEYSFVPHDVYCTKRAEILQGFLNNRPRIFLNDVMHEALETRARENLQTEIDLLRQGKIPGGGEEEEKK